MCDMSLLISSVCLTLCVGAQGRGGGGCPVFRSLVERYRAEDFADEEEACIETDEARQHEEDDGEDESVAKVEEPGDKVRDGELGSKVEDGVEEEIEPRRSASEIGAPPPMIVFAAELEVAHDDRDLCARNDEDDKDYEQEAEDVEELVAPDGAEDEEELDEDSAERQDAAHQHAQHRAHVPHLVRDLPRDLVCCDRVLQCWLLECNKAADKHQWQRNPKVHRNDRQ